jgi:hypothetical protein
MRERERERVYGEEREVERRELCARKRERKGGTSLWLKERDLSRVPLQLYRSDLEAPKEDICAQPLYTARAKINGD